MITVPAGIVNVALLVTAICPFKRYTLEEDHVVLAVILAVTSTTALFKGLYAFF